MVQQVTIKLPQYVRGIHLITERIVEELPPLPQAGILHLFIQHTSAGLTINENADPSVRDDLDKFFDRVVPEDQSLYMHTQEGPDDMPAHIKASLVGFSVQIPITNKKLNLGIWQGVYLCEFRNNGGRRKVLATIIG
ncbi:MAG: secondary thiamine-phosphate synthase enzyme YjbQ [Bacteroidales bacterium]|mgnify:CR=1 FL=1|jgi:secondary thiamine-phosphate synthase enzyme|nr:secondary thiamine-phosphate synthase enzyme YjbQ [Bacteroidales bacterium]MDD4383813.1 secondary thiamine-phosphate synthase enzyme YjbQ [Bacteroidales bacterium]MDY0197997.1 secondary thiamine-phosphate synthase enzyme YjbQ [Tenuifilaceae bacterium]